MRFGKLETYSGTYRHVHFEDLGSFVQPLQAAGYEIRYLEAVIDDLNSARKAELTVFLG